MRAASAAGSWKGPPRTDRDEKPPVGTNTDTGPLDAFSLRAMSRPSAALSSAVTRMSVMCSLCR